MICGANGWKFLEPVMNVIGYSDVVKVFIFDENSCARISIEEAIRQLYAEASKLFKI